MVCAHVKNAPLKSVYNAAGATLMLCTLPVTVTVWLRLLVSESRWSVVKLATSCSSQATPPPRLSWSSELPRPPPPPDPPPPPHASELKVKSMKQYWRLYNYRYNKTILWKGQASQSNTFDPDKTCKINRNDGNLNIKTAVSQFVYISCWCLLSNLQVEYWKALKESDWLSELMTSEPLALAGEVHSEGTPGSSIGRRSSEGRDPGLWPASRSSGRSLGTSRLPGLLPRRPCSS